MKGLSDFLSKYKNFTPPAKAAARAVRAAIEQVLGVSVPEESITVKHGVARVLAGGALKSEVLLNKGKVVQAAREQVGDGLRDIL